MTREEGIIAGIVYSDKTDLHDQVTELAAFVAQVREAATRDAFAEACRVLKEIETREVADKLWTALDGLTKSVSLGHNR